MELNGVTVAVIGIGASGSAAARLAAEQGGDVYVSDSRTDEAATAHGALLGDAGISVELGRHDIERIAGADIVEFNPKRDPQEITAMVAVKILKEVAARMIELPIELT